MNDYRTDASTNELLREILTEIRELNNRLTNPTAQGARCLHKHHTLGVKCGLEIGHEGMHSFRNSEIEATWLDAPND